MTAGTTTVAVAANHAARIAELLDFLADTAAVSEESLEGEELRETIRERISARHWARELRDAINRRPPATANLNTGKKET